MKLTHDDVFFIGMNKFTNESKKRVGGFLIASKSDDFNSQDI
jgi:hypothetical protein